MLLSDNIPAIYGCAEKRGLVSSSSFAKDGVAGAVHVKDSSLGVTDYQVSTLVHTRDMASAAPPHDDLFDTTVLDEPANIVSTTSYGPSYFRPSFPLSLAWLASLLRYTKSPGLKIVLRTLGS
ncbi:hypothetical protein Tco_1146162 [Tanacetum coccineum]